MIKKAFYILLVALMALPVSCSKDHKSSKATPGIKASNLEGTWIATQYINGDMEDVSNICLLIKSSNPGFTYTLFNEGGNDREGTCSLDGNILRFYGGYKDDDTVKVLDSRHLILTTTSDEKISYTKVEDLLQGTWKASHGSVSMTVTITKDANSAFPATVDGSDGTSFLELGIKESAEVVVNFAGGPLNDSFTLLHVEDYLFSADCDGDEWVFMREKPAPQSVFKEKDLAGTWVETQAYYFGNGIVINDPVANIFNPDKTYVSSSQYGSDNNDGTWDLNGNVLRLRNSSTVTDKMLKELDGKHMAWISPDGLWLQKCTNVTSLLTGKWLIAWQKAWFVVTFDKSGSSSWLEDGTTNAGEYDWTLDVDGGHVILKFIGTNGNTWHDDLTINTLVGDDYMTSTNAAGGPVTLRRL